MTNPRSDNPAAFVTASMQAVIQKLRIRKRLEVLHRAERERAQQTETLERSRDSQYARRPPAR